MLILLSIADTFGMDTTTLVLTTIAILFTSMALTSVCNCTAYTSSGASQQRKIRDKRALAQTIQMNKKSNDIWKFSSRPAAPAFEHPISVALTGARGMVGTGVITTLLQGGRCKHIVMLDVLKESIDFQKKKEDALKNYNVHLYYVAADITDKDAMCNPDGLVQRIFHQAEVQTMLHIAALVGPFFKIPLYMKVNYQGTLNVLDACRAAGIGAVVDCSSPSTRFDGSDICGLNEEQVWTSLHERYQGTEKREKYIFFFFVLSSFDFSFF